MQTLINTITEQTQSFKAEYITKTKVYAEKYFNFVKAEYVKYYSKEFQQNEEGKRYYDLQKKVHGVYGTIVSGGIDKFIAKEVKTAEVHYAQSVEKLAFRITEKGLNLDALKVVTAHVGVNLEITFTDTVKYVRAFTIIAEGPIQRPHYRYLIK
jgi:hypothetical protein